MNSILDTDPVLVEPRRERGLTRAVLVAGAVALAGVLISGCGGSIGPVVDQTQPAAAQTTGSGPGSEASGAGSTAASPSASGTGTAAPAASKPAVAPPPPPQLGEGVVSGAPVWDQLAAQGAEEAALEAMAAFTNTKLDKDEWVAGIKPMLTGRAQQAWSNPGLSAFAATSVTGSPRLEVESPANPYWVWAVVPTNDGDYRVHLNRTKTGAPWLADMIRPAQLKK